MNYFIDYFFTKPERLINFGWILAMLGMGFILIALSGQVVTSAANAMGVFSTHAVIPKTLADIYPSIPTWWVPESIVGALPAIFLVVAGLWINHTGKYVRRIYG